MKRNHQLARVCLIAAGLGSANAAFAQVSSLAQELPAITLLGDPDPESRYYIGAWQAFTWDDNLFRVRGSAEKSEDVISTTSLRGGFNLPVGRQRFFGDGVVRYNRYNENSQLDGTGFSANVGWDWATIERLSGTLSYTANQSQAAFGVEAPLITTKRNTERSQQFLARGQLGATSLLSLETTYIHRRLDYSAIEFAAQEFDSDSLSLGVLYRPSGILTLGIAGRGTRGSYPFGSAVPPLGQEDEFERKDVDLTAVWVPTALSKLAGRISYSDEDHERNPGRDFSGVTGGLVWEYKPTGKLTFITDLLRDTGSESSFKSVTSITGIATTVGNTSQVSDSFQVRALWEFSPKVQFHAVARILERDLVTTNPPASGTDRTSVALIGGRWAPTRALTFGCSVGYEKHSGSEIVSGPYEANVVGCAAQFLLH
jgi:hypothetical protein